MPLIFCGNGSVTIPYNEIRAYGPPKNICEGFFSSGIGCVNLWVSTRLHSLSSWDCRERQMVIEWRQSDCRRMLLPYKQITIAIDGNKYAALKRLLDSKVDNDRTAML